MTSNPDLLPCPLNEDQKKLIKAWAADDRLWNTQDTVEFNLTVFARAILTRAQPKAPIALGGGDTPLTDAKRFEMISDLQSGYRYCVSADFAMQLERQLTQSRAECERLKLEHDAWRVVAEGREKEIHGLINERDQLRTQVDGLSSGLKALTKGTIAGARLHNDNTQLLQSHLELARKALEKIWTDDECGYLTSSTSDKIECVKCGGIGPDFDNIKHDEDCFQNLLYQTLKTISGEK